MRMDAHRTGGYMEKDREQRRGLYGENNSC